MKEKLDYDNGIVILFIAEVSDIGNNTTPFSVIVYVENIPSRRPIWIRPFASARFPEKTNQTFEIFAIDGDRGIQNSICYKVEFANDTNCKYCYTYVYKTTFDIYFRWCSHINTR